MGPLEIGLIVGGVTLVAVAVILYFLVFKNMIARGNQKRRENNTKKATERLRSTSMASDLFQQQQQEQEEKAADAEAFKKDIERIINPNVQKPVEVEAPKKPKAAPKKKPEPKVEKAFDPFAVKTPN